MASNKTPVTPDINCDCYSDSHKPDACPPVKNVTHPLRYYEFTQDEIKVLEECDKESFYKRCLPFSTVLAASTFFGIKRGILDKHPHFGAVPKVTVAILLGFILGRLVYVPHCEKKLIKKLPADSHLAMAMKQHQIDKNPPEVDPKKKPEKK